MRTSTILIGLAILIEAYKCYLYGWNFFPTTPLEAIFDLLIGIFGGFGLALRLFLRDYDNK